MSKLLFSPISIGLILTLFSSSGLAFPNYLDIWRSQYPSSSSADISCQLCHRDRDGGTPWNAYGNDIRLILNENGINSRSIEDSIHMAEELNSDQDSPSTSNLIEINANTQPAWREGLVNPVYDNNSVIVGLNYPPLTVDPFPQKIESIDLSIELVDTAIGFTAPVASAIAPGSNLSRQLFIADQIGIIWRVDLRSGLKSEYLNLQDRLLELGAFEACGYDERGLLGLAFHPEFANNGRLYVYTSQEVSGTADFTTLSSGEVADHQSVISELIISNPTDTSSSAQILSERDLLRLDQPQFNHNGGALIFDSNNLLYIGLGDGGGADDQGIGHSSIGNGSDPLNPFGSILRIDPLANNSNNGKYGIPISNPFINDSARLNEIYAYGFRNPWKLSFDQQGRLIAADVGQNDIEEINIVEAGMHYGWRIKEGRFFFDDNGDFSGVITFDFPDTPASVNLINPTLEYDHDEGISVIGGYIYSGLSNPSLTNKYIFADFTKTLFIGNLMTEEVKKVNADLDLFVFGLAQDSLGELYIMGSENISTCATSTSGRLVKLKSALAIDDSFCLPIKTINGKFATVCL